MLGKPQPEILRSPYRDGAMAGRPPSREAPLFGRRLAELRKQRGLTQAQLAAQLGVKLSLVAYYERRTKNPTLEVANKIALFFDVPISILLEEKKPSKAKRQRPGPPSELEAKIELLRQLPKRDQETVIKMLDGLLSSTARH